jgi:hypothetical protein
MTTKPTFWQRIGIQDWLLNDTGSSTVGKLKQLTPDLVFKYITGKFQESLAELSFAQRIVFYHEYIICLNVDDYREFNDHKKGILGLVAQESVKNFYDILNLEAGKDKKVEPSSNKWVFRFVSHPDYKPGDIGFIGKLMPESVQKEENLRVTFIPRQTGLAQTFDVDNDILKDFTYYSEGYYEIPYIDNMKKEAPAAAKISNKLLARFETTIPDKAYSGQKLEFMMKSTEIVVSGDEETRNTSDVFKVPSEWVNTPHLKIRFEESEDKFYIASFGEKTIVNETLVGRSEVEDPIWSELPLNSRIVLNGIIGMNIFKS